MITKTLLQFRADPKCNCCGGKGYVTDHVPYGSTSASFDSECDCAVELLTPEEYARCAADIDDGNYEVIPSVEWEKEMERIDEEVARWESGEGRRG